MKNNYLVRCVKPQKQVISPSSYYYSCWFIACWERVYFPYTKYLLHWLSIMISLLIIHGLLSSDRCKLGPRHTEFSSQHQLIQHLLHLMTNTCSCLWISLMELRKSSEWLWFGLNQFQTESISQWCLFTSMLPLELQHFYHWMARCRSINR